MKLLGGRTVLDRVADVLHAECEERLINANGDPARFAAFGLPVVADSVEGFAGPLAGVLAALDWTAENRPGVDWVVSAAADTPFLPPDFVSRLHRARQEAGTALAQASSGGQTSQVNALWKVSLRDDLRRALVDEGLRKVSIWADRHGVAQAEWPVEPVDPFFNVNRPEDLAEAEQLLTRLG